MATSLSGAREKLAAIRQRMHRPHKPGSRLWRFRAWSLFILLQTLSIFNLSQPLLPLAKAESEDESRLLSQARAAFDSHQYALARTYYELALQKTDVGHNLLSAAHIYSQIGRIEIKLRSPERAIDAYSRALSLVTKAGGPAQAAALRNQNRVDLQGAAKALAALQIPNFESIRARYQQDLDRCLAVPHYCYLEGSIFGLLGEAYYLHRQYRDAMSLYEYLTRVADPTYRVSDYYDPPFWSRPSRVGGDLRYFQLDVYPRLIRMLIEANQIDRAVEIAEKGRAAQLVAIMEARHFTGNRPIVQEKLDVTRIRKIAKDLHTTFVFYSLLNEQTVGVWALSSNSHVCFSSSVFRGSDNKTIEQLTTDISRSLHTRGDIRGLSPVIKQTKDNLRTLYEHLIAPIASCLPTDPRSLVTLIPDGSLFGVPFYALVDENEKPVIESHTLSITPSIHVLHLLSELAVKSPTVSWTHMAGNEVLVVGNPKMPALPQWEPPGRGEKVGRLSSAARLPQLHGAETEAKDVANLFGTKAYIGAAALGASIVERMPTARLIHMATHGLLVNQSLLSFGEQSASISYDLPPGALAVAPAAVNERGGNEAGDERDESLNRGFLTSGQILKSNLQADLVVLSACDTARGRVAEEEIVGLPASLIASGAHSVIMTLWSIPDEPTAELMQKFYSELRSGTSKAQALRQAMLSTKRKYPSATDWAAFMLIGLPE